MDRALAQTICLAASAGDALAGRDTDPRYEGSPLEGSQGFSYRLSAGKRTLAEGDTFDGWIDGMRRRGTSRVMADVIWVQRGPTDAEGQAEGAWQWSILAQHDMRSREAWRVFWETEDDVVHLHLVGRFLDMHDERGGTDAPPSLREARRALATALAEAERFSEAHGHPEWATLFQTVRAGAGNGAPEQQVPREVLPPGRRWDGGWRLLRTAVASDLFWTWPPALQPGLGEEACRGLDRIAGQGRSAVVRAVRAGTLGRGRPGWWGR